MLLSFLITEILYTLGVGSKARKAVGLVWKTIPSDYENERTKSAPVFAVKYIYALKYLLRSLLVYFHTGRRGQNRLGVHHT